MTLLNAYKLSWAMASRLPWPARSVHSRLWLQLLSSQDLIDLTVSSYSQSGFESEDHNFSGLWTWENAAIQRCFGGCNTVLVAAAGGGREMIALSESGFLVIGFDVSADLIENGRRNLAKAGVSAELLLAPACQVPANLQVYDSLVVGRGAYHHIPDRHRRIAFLRACRKHLRQGAPLFIGDFLMRESGHVARIGRREKGDSVSTSFFHYFNEAEVRQETDEAGFDLLEFRRTPFPGGGNLAHVIGKSR